LALIGRRIQNKHGCVYSRVRGGKSEFDAESAPKRGRRRELRGVGRGAGARRFPLLRKQALQGFPQAETRRRTRLRRRLRRFDSRRSRVSDLPI